MARTYLERHLEEFENASREELIRHGLRALKESMSQDKELTIENTSVGVIGVVQEGKRKGKVESFKLDDGPEVGSLLEASLETVEAGETAGGAGEESMDVDS